MYVAEAMVLIALVCISKIISLCQWICQQVRNKTQKSHYLLLTQWIRYQWLQIHSKVGLS